MALDMVLDQPRFLIPVRALVTDPDTVQDRLRFPIQARDPVMDPDTIPILTRAKALAMDPDTDPTRFRRCTTRLRPLMVVLDIQADRAVRS
jgi:hypothetical protein